MKSRTLPKNLWHKPEECPFKIKIEFRIEWSIWLQHLPPISCCSELALRVGTPRRLWKPTVLSNLRLDSSYVSALGIWTFPVIHTAPCMQKILKQPPNWCSIDATTSNLLENWQDSCMNQTYLHFKIIHYHMWGDKTSTIIPNISFPLLTQKACGFCPVFFFFAIQNFYSWFCHSDWILESLWCRIWRIKRKWQHWKGRKKQETSGQPLEKEIMGFRKDRNRGAWGMREMNGKYKKILRTNARNYFAPSR